MKQRKKPILLVTVLVLMVVAVAILSFPKDLLKGPPPPAPTPTTGQDINVPGRKDIAKGVSEQMKRRGGPPGMPGEPYKPSIQLDTQQSSSYKPKPNDSSTSTQWYSNETPKSFPKK